MIEINVNVDYSKIDAIFVPQIEKSVENLKKGASKAVEEACKEYSKKLRSELEDMYEEIITEFYASSHGEHRGTMYNLMTLQKIDGNDAGFIINVEENIPPNGGNSTNVFQNVFMQGYHGGSDNIHGYRAPREIWNRWIMEGGKPKVAPQSASPDSRIIEEIDSRGPGWSDELSNLIKQKISALSF